jgi:hypothetical protein
MAFEVGWTDGGLAVGRLTVRGADVPGRRVIIDREFRLVEEPPENPGRGGDGPDRCRRYSVLAN